MKCLFALVPWSVASLLAAQPKHHVLDPGPKTVHIGFFDASLAPVLEVDSGDIIRVKTASGNPRYYEELGVPKEKIPTELYSVYEGAEGSGRSDHTLTGPIYVRGAEPGDTLGVRIREIELWLPIAGQGFVPGRGVLPEEFPYAWNKVHFPDLEKKTLAHAPGVIIPLAPFWGVIGVAPPSSMGRVPSGPPNVFGGNLDNRDLRPGTSLFLPVHVKGALLSLGDGHAAEGYGEVCLSAVETSLQGEIQVVVHKGERLRWPRAETEAHYIAMGLHTDLNEAVKLATRDMLDFVVETKGLAREDAYLLLSAAMDLVVTQAVDGTKGIHALLPKAIFRESEAASRFSHDGLRHRRPCCARQRFDVICEAGKHTDTAGGLPMRLGHLSRIAVAAALVALAAGLEGADNPVIVIETSLGNIEAELYPDRAPKSVENILAYIKDGFYDGTVFHRVIPGFMIQGGGLTADLKRKPTRAPVENEASNSLKNQRGTVAMARTAEIHSATSQFFINTADNTALDHKGMGVRDYGYCVFGKVTEGMDVVEAIEKVKTGAKDGYKDVPLEPVVIKSIRLKAE